MKTIKLLFLFITAILLSIGSFFIMPVADDYVYLCTPQGDIDLIKFLPQGAFWRPFDYAWGIISGQFMSLYPFLHHLLVTIVYILSLYGTYILLKRCNIKGFPLFISLTLFVCSPMLVASTYSLDSVAQVLSVAFGLSSLIVYKNKKWLSYIFMVLAVFSKESGIAWFAVTPAINEWIIDNKVPLKLNNKSNFLDSLKRVGSLYSIPVLLIVLYTISRFALFVEGTEVTSGRYSSDSLSLINVIKGFALLFGSVTTCIDTIAYFVEKNYFIVIFTIIISLAFLYVVFKNIIYKGNGWRIFILICSVFALASPHVVIEHPGEMHAYPTLWIFAFSTGVLLKDFDWKKIDKAIVYTFFVVSVMVFIHKAYYMYNNGQQAFSRVKTAVENTHFIPKHVFILDLDKEQTIYSVFQNTGTNQWEYGKGTRIFFDFKNPEIIDYRCADIDDKEAIINEVKSNKGDIECIWVVENNIVEVIDIRD